MRDDEGRSFGHWGSSGKQRGAKSNTPNDDAAKQRIERLAHDLQVDGTHENLETIAQRRQRRDRLVEAPIPPAPTDAPAISDNLRRLAERKQKSEASDLTEPMWDRVVELAKSFMSDQPATPPRSPGAPPNGRQRRTPGR